MKTHRIAAISLFLLLSVHLTSAVEDPAALLELRQGWVESRAEAQQMGEKMYFDQLQELKENFVRAGNIAAAIAVNNAITGEEKGDNDPVMLINARKARDNSLDKAFRPLDKQYWQELKKLKEDFQKQGDLAGVISIDVEIKKVLAPYVEPAPVSEKPAPVSASTKQLVQEEMLIRMEPVYSTTLDSYPLRINENGGYYPSPTINRKVCDEYIFAVAPSLIRYDIPPGAKWFKAVGLSFGGGAFKFVVTIDGDQLFESKPLNLYDYKQVKVRVKIPDEAKQIELIVDNLGNSNDDNSVWAYPRFSY